MEKKRKVVRKPTQSTQEGDTNDFLSNEDQPQKVTRKNAKPCSPSQDDNKSTATQQCTPIFQWQFTQPILRQSPLISRPAFPAQPPLLIASNQLKTTPFNTQPIPQLHPLNHAQYGSSPSEPAVTTGSFWLPPGPGLPSLGATAAQPFTRIGTADTSWQTPMGAGGGASARIGHHIPGFCYQGGHSYPMGFPGSWNPSSWWGQAQQAQPPCTYNLPGTYCFFPFPTPVSDISSEFGQNHQKGIIRTDENLSPKHQKIWEAQSPENIQLWAVIEQLQAELSVCGSRLMKLEAEVYSLKSSGPGASAGIAPIGQISKRGRPKKVAPAAVLFYDNESQLQACQKKPALSETKGLTALKESLQLQKEKDYKSEVGNSDIRKQNNGKDTNQLNAKMPQDIKATSNLLSEDKPRPNTIANPSLGIQGDDRNVKEPLICQVFKGAKMSNIEHNGRNFVDNRCQAFYNNVPGWSFMNENAREEHEDVVVESGKDDNKQELEDTSSGADETKVESSYEMNSSGGTKFWLS